jgi:multidrug efflux pump subunit AcrA (membrane-fusion protein)
VSVAQSLRGSHEEVFPLRAPFTGTVVQVLKTEGEYVEQQNAQAGSAIVRIDDLSRLFVDASAPEIEIGKLKEGQDAIIKASAILTKSFHGKIRKITLASKEQKDWDRSRVEFPVMIEVTDPQERELKSGMSVVVDIVTRQIKDVLTLRHEYIQKEGDKFWVTLENGTRKGVEIGAQNEEVVEIRNGIQEGEKVRQIDFLSVSQE